MVRAEFKRALKVAEDELGDCLKQHQRLEKRILELRQVINSLSNAINEGKQPEIKPGGLVAAAMESSLISEIEGIFRAKTSQILNAQDIVEELEKLGRNMGKYQNQLATVGVMLGRLKERGKIRSVKDDTGKRGFVAQNPFPIPGVD
jgi:hypothetical protein